MNISNQTNKVYNNNTSNFRKIENNIQKSNENLSSGKKVNNSSDDAASMAIIEKMEALIAGIGKGVNNTYDMQNALKVADSGLDSIESGLQRVRELGVQATNSTLSKSDKEIIQTEIDSILDGINNISSSIQFNGQNLLDGSFVDKSVAMDENGDGPTISIGSADVASLGLIDFNVTGDSIDLSSIDKAISSVSSARTQIGAQINRFDYAISSSEDAIVNHKASKSRLQDADIAKEVIDANTNKALSQYGIFAQKNRAQTQYNMLNVLF